MSNSYVPGVHAVKLAGQLYIAKKDCHVRNLVVSSGFPAPRLTRKDALMCGFNTVFARVGPVVHTAKSTTALPLMNLLISCLSSASQLYSRRVSFPTSSE